MIKTEAKFKITVGKKELELSHDDALNLYQFLLTYFGPRSEYYYNNRLWYSNSASSTFTIPSNGTFTVSGSIAKVEDE